MPPFVSWIATDHWNCKVECQALSRLRLPPVLRLQLPFESIGNFLFEFPEVCTFYNVALGQRQAEVIPKAVIGGHENDMWYTALESTIPARAYLNMEGKQRKAKFRL